MTRQRSLAFTAEHVALCADKYLMARVYGVGSKEKSFAELRRALNRWRKKAKRAA